MMKGLLVAGRYTVKIDNMTFLLKRQWIIIICKKAFSKKFN